MRKFIKEADRFIRSQTEIEPEVAVIFGTGLADGQLTENFKQISYGEIPHFPGSTVKGHKGEFYIGSYNNMPIAILSGRSHFYEGYSMKEITFPIRLLKSLGVGVVILTNVAGSVNPEHIKGDLVLIEDHINLQPENPLRGDHDEKLGPRFPDMMQAYDPVLCKILRDTAAEMDIELKSGVYAALQGPNLETPAEYKFLHIIGADLVGMSTVPEVIVCRHSGIRVAALSIVSNLCFPKERIRKTSIQSVLKIAEAVRPRLHGLIRGTLDKLSAKY